ncbi:hypothetical protein PR048_012996 [Dryococelus australis]|uniref:Uncharacterized protein n=1 Tax=Dryococelus australis TaxID=614101 RepID=A0ABQ9HQX5_9NEOP|nr:hypothetical protein PR048_012996 [Dryococelus australis]
MRRTHSLMISRESWENLHTWPSQQHFTKQWSWLLASLKLTDEEVRCMFHLWQQAAFGKRNASKAIVVIMMSHYNGVGRATNTSP